MSDISKACHVCGGGMLGIGYTCTGCGRVGESTDIYDRHRSVCMDRDHLAAQLSQLQPILSVLGDWDWNGIVEDGCWREEYENAMEAVAKAMAEVELAKGKKEESHG